MGVIAHFNNQVIGIDTAPLIYFIERHPNYLPFVKPFFVALANQQFRVVTSTVTLLEVLIHPLRKSRPDLMTDYRDILLNSEQILTVPVSAEIAERAATIRSQYNFRTPDAIQLATALEHGASHFVTNDLKLRAFPLLQVHFVNDL